MCAVLAAVMIAGLHSTLMQVQGQSIEPIEYSLFFFFSPSVFFSFFAVTVAVIITVTLALIVFAAAVVEFEITVTF